MFKSPLSLVRGLAFIPAMGRSVVCGPLMVIDSSKGWLVPCRRVPIDPYGSALCGAVPSFVEWLWGV